MSILRPVDLGLIDYRECVSLQQKLIAQRHAGEIADTLLLLDGTQYPDMRDGIIAGVGVIPGAANNGFGSYQELNPDPRIP